MSEVYDEELAAADGVIALQRKELKRLRADRAELLAEFNRFMTICGEGSARGRALDLIPRNDWERARAAIAKVSK